MKQVMRVVVMVLLSAGVTFGAEVKKKKAVKTDKADLEDRIRQVEEQLKDRIQQLEEEVAGLKAEQEEDGSTLDAHWKNGFRLTSRDGEFDLRFRTMVQLDFASFFNDEEINDALAAEAEEGEDPDRMEDGAEIRRARFGFEGTLYENMGFEVVYDFAGDQVEPVDVFLALLDLPVLGEVRVGHQREPFSRLQGGSQNYIFMEKGLYDALIPDRNLGVRILQTALDERMTLSAGAYYETGDSGVSVEGDAYDAAARISGLLWYEEDSGRLLHLAASYCYRRPPEDAFDFGSRPESHLAETLIGRTDIPADSANLYGGEAALVLGALSFLSEYVLSATDIQPGTSADLEGYYATVSYFLTGETRGYDREEGKMSGVKPNRNFRDGAGGWGAWELAARISELDLNGSSVNEGELTDITGAINWYLNPNVKMLLNYIYAEDEGNMNILQGRVQFGF